MKIVAFDAGRVTLLAPLEEFIPLGGVDGRDIVQKLAERYRFLRPPNLTATREELDKNGLTFENGLFMFNGMQLPIVAFSAFNDGLVVLSQDTERSEAFLDDVIVWLRSEFNFRAFASEAKRYFSSQLVVEFECPLGGLIAAYDTISTAIASALEPIYKAKPKMRFARLDFEAEKTPETPIAIPRFMIERRAGASFESERYFCGAPMRTTDHVAVLQAIERACLRQA